MFPTFSSQLASLPSVIPKFTVSTAKQPFLIAGKQVFGINLPSSITFVTSTANMTVGAPHPATVTALVSGFLLAWLLVHFYRTRNNTPLREVPGPWFASCSPLYRFYYAVMKGNWHHDLINLHRKYGNIVRIAPTEVSVWDPTTGSEIYGHGDKGYPKCEMYDIALPNGFFNLAVERDIARHAAGRRVIAKDYTMAATLENEKYMDSVVDVFIKALDKTFAQTGKICNWTIWSEYFSYDMITDLVFGTAFGFCKTGTDVGNGLSDLRTMLNLSPFLSYMPWVWGITKNKYVKMAGQAHYSKGTVREITKRLDNDGVNPTGRSDLLQGLLDARYPDGSKLPLGEITNHAYIFILAAPDTVSVALRNIVINLVRNPERHARLLAELTSANLSKTPTWKELEQIPFLLAVVKESLRLAPPAGFTLPRAVPEGGRTICGKFLPGGVTVGMSAWSNHHNQDFWGKDTVEFVPERWLDKEQAMKLERYGLTFGQGARACLGKHIALMQLVKATAQLVLSFDFGLVDEHKMKEMFLLLVIIDNCNVWLKRRAGGPLDETVGMVETLSTKTEISA